MRFPCCKIRQKANSCKAIRKSSEKGLLFDASSISKRGKAGILAGIPYADVSLTSRSSPRAPERREWRVCFFRGA
jgi:hypothetical protein